MALKLSGKTLTLRDELLLLLLQRVEEPDSPGGGKQLRAKVCMSKLGNEIMFPRAKKDQYLDFELLFWINEGV